MDKKFGYLKFGVLIVLIIFVVVLLFTPREDFSHAKRVFENNSRVFESIANYMQTESTWNWYLGSPVFPDRYYKNFKFPEAVSRDMEKYFDAIVPEDGSIAVLKEETTVMWHLSESNYGSNLPEIVSFFLWSHNYSWDVETENYFIEDDYIYFARLSTEELTAFLEHDSLNSYEVTQIEENWFYVARR